MKTAVDLFAGAGGFSLGAELAGYTVDHAVEIDRWACQTLERNHPGTNVHCADLTSLDDAWIKANLTPNPDLLIGGPPCQGFSHAAVGRQDPKDPRNSLFREFVRVARILEPRRIVMENVPGILRARTATGASVSDLVVAELEGLGYHVNTLVLNAHDFGVPQIRRRVFFVADDTAMPPDELLPTHGPANGPNALHPVVTVRDALADLPIVDVGDTRDPVPYERPPGNAYQHFARHGGGDAVFNHVPMKHSARMVARFREIRPGGSQSDVSEEHAPRLRVRTEEQGPARFDQNNRRMHWDRPCHTVPATFYANFVHPELHRNFTPREGARIQSFPDRYVFHGKPTVVSAKLLTREGRVGEKHLCQYVQIGNAVPPLLGEAVLSKLSAMLDHVQEESRRTDVA